jgi:hypothetical protein
LQIIIGKNAAEFSLASLALQSQKNIVFVVVMPKGTIVSMATVAIFIFKLPFAKIFSLFWQYWYDRNNPI